MKAELESFLLLWKEEKERKKKAIEDQTNKKRNRTYNHRKFY